MEARAAYEWLVTHHLKLSHLASASSVLAWDQRTYMPPGGAQHRTNQMAVFAGMMHQRATDERIDEHLATVEGSPLIAEATSTEAVNVREWRRVYDRQRKIPMDLAVELARASSDAETVWERARPSSDWDALEPKLNLLVSLQKERAAALGFEKEAYDALLEDYEPGMRATTLVDLFEDLRAALTGLLAKIRGSSRKADLSLVRREFPGASQEAFAREIASRIGYDFECGRLDVSAHPFSISIGPGDSRITTRFNERFFNTAFFGTIHESGHGMYEQGLPRDHWGTPRGESVSLGVHESQSRLWENMVARSRPFWKFAWGGAKKHFPSLADVALEDFLLAVNGVEPSLIRVEADEITYNLHIALRFEIELDLIRGNLTTADLPDAWNEKTQKYLGLSPANHSEGVMQDVHWPGGAFGYFPTYTLGNLFAAQLMEAARSELPDLDASFEKGEFSALKGWLHEKVHTLGCTYQPADLIQEATGSAPSARALIAYYNQKFSDLYGL